LPLPLDEIRGTHRKLFQSRKAIYKKFCAPRSDGRPIFDVGLIHGNRTMNAFYTGNFGPNAPAVSTSFRSEYIFDLEAAVVVETPQTGSPQTYLFSKPTSLNAILVDITAGSLRINIRHNRNNAAERLGFLGRLFTDGIHGHGCRS